MGMQGNGRIRDAVERSIAPRSGENDGSKVNICDQIERPSRLCGGKPENNRVTQNNRVNRRVKVVKIGAVQEIPQPFGQARGRKRSFLVLVSFQLSHRALRTCSFAKVSPKPKNPRSERPRYFLKCSSQQIGHSRVETWVATRIYPLKAMQVVDFPDIEHAQSKEGGANIMNAPGLRACLKIQRGAVFGPKAGRRQEEEMQNADGWQIR